ncbi:MAG: ABC transporter ATP-binding protein [Bilifractor sp.]|jgi:oligopeptide transport system ATP-binding protein
MLKTDEVILSVRGLKKYFPVPNAGLKPQKRKYVHAVDGVSFDIMKGETLGLVGESGCGKSTVGRLLVGIEKPTEGEVLYRGRDLADMKSREARSVRTELQMIFQDSYSSLNPRKRVYDIISAPMIYHGLADKNTAPEKVRHLLELVGLPENSMRRYPHEFSGGQRQRIAIAKALSLNPNLIVCDEPVSALDMSIQAQILNLLKDLQDELGVTYLFIAHGLGAVHYVSHRIAVMYLGKIVETGSGSEVFRHPFHPYSEALIAAVPVADPTRRGSEDLVPKGEVPSAVDLPEGCRFAARCPYAQERCLHEQPELVNMAAPGEPVHEAACFFRPEERRAR